MKGLFKSKPRTPADIVRQTRDLLVYAQRAPDPRESKREKKVDLGLVDVKVYIFKLLPLDDPNPTQSSQIKFPSSLKSILTSKNLSILLGPLLSTVISLCVNLDGTVASRNMLAVLAWVFARWLTEAVPMPVTSMSPLFLFPLFGIASADDVAHSYMNDVIALGSWKLYFGSRR
ncbi:hypothetical protein ACFX14_005472 [Malus domestica]